MVEDWAFITHSGEVSEETLQELTALVRELAPFKEVFITQAGCTVSSHCGPGTLGVLFLRPFLRRLCRIGGMYNPTNYIA